MNSLTDKEKIESLLAKAKAANLDGLDFLQQFSVDEICRGYNGIGPAFLPTVVREKVTEWLGLFEPPAMIHDMRNEVSDGTRAGFLAANDEFRRNCLKVADAAYPWYNRKRYRARAAGLVLYELVSAEDFGWRAWQDAHRKHLDRQEANPQT